MHQAAYTVENYGQTVDMISQLYDSSFSPEHQAVARVLIEKVEASVRKAHLDASGGMHGSNPSLNFATGLKNRKLDQSGDNDATDLRDHAAGAIMVLDFTLIEQAARLFTDVELFYNAYFKGGRDPDHPLIKGFHDSSESGNAMKKHLVLTGEELTFRLTPNKDHTTVLSSLLADKYGMSRSREIRSSFDMGKSNARGYESDASTASAAAYGSDASEAAPSRKISARKARKRKSKGPEGREVSFRDDEGYASAASETSVKSGYSTDGGLPPRPATPKPPSTTTQPPAPLKPALKSSRSSFPEGTTLSIDNADLVTPRDLPNRMRKKLEREYRDQHREFFRDDDATKLCMRSSSGGLYASACDPATATVRRGKTHCAHHHGPQLPRLSTKQRFDLFRDLGFLYSGCPDIPDAGNYGSGRGRGDRGRGDHDRGGRGNGGRGGWDDRARGDRGHGHRYGYGGGGGPDPHRGDGGGGGPGYGRGRGRGF